MQQLKITSLFLILFHYEVKDPYSCKVILWHSSYYPVDQHSNFCLESYRTVTKVARMHLASNDPHPIVQMLEGVKPQTISSSLGDFNRCVRGLILGWIRSISWLRIPIFIFVQENAMMLPARCSKNRKSGLNERQRPEKETSRGQIVRLAPLKFLYAKKS